MTAPEHFILAGTSGVPPRRPAADCEDFGGLLFTNDVIDTPDVNEHLAAQDFKQVEMCLQGALRMIPLLSVDFTGHATTPTVDAVMAPNPALTTSTVTFVRADVGEYTLAWPAGSLPAATLRTRFHQQNYMVIWSQTGSSITMVVGNIDLSPTDSFSMSIDIFGE